MSGDPTTLRSLAARAEDRDRAQAGHLLKALRRVRNSRDWEDAVRIAKNAIAQHERTVAALTAAAEHAP